jgi:hypothetical protein
VGEIATQAATFGGMVLVQVGDIAKRMNEGAFPHDAGLILAGSAAGLLVFGVHLGRLLMRWQLCRLQATIDGESGLITARA